MAKTWKTPPTSIYDRCPMGGPLGDDFWCWGEVPSGELWCAACQHDIDNDIKGTCDCPGCSRDFMAEVARLDGPEEGR